MQACCHYAGLSIRGRGQAGQSPAPCRGSRIARLSENGPHEGTGEHHDSVQAAPIAAWVELMGII